jgi:negative regulator of flagellin synthesis FlgM
MVIDINNSITPGSPRSRGSVNNPTAEKPQTVATTPGKTSGGKDNVVLSPEAQNLNRLQAKISSMPDADLERVEQIKKAIAEGKFEINAGRIAENMLNQEELLG